MKECKILSFVTTYMNPSKEVARAKYKGVSTVSNQKVASEIILYENPEFEAKLNKYLKDGWEVKFAISSDKLYLERELDK